MHVEVIGQHHESSVLLSLVFCFLGFFVSLFCLIVLRQGLLVNLLLRNLTGLTNKHPK